MYVYATRLAARRVICSRRFAERTRISVRVIVMVFVRSQCGWAIVVFSFRARDRDL